MSIAQTAIDRFVATVPGIHWDDLIKQYGSLDVVVQQGLYLPELLQAAAEAAGPALAIGIDPGIRPDDYSKGFSDVSISLDRQTGSVSLTPTGELSQGIPLSGVSLFQFLCGFMAMAGRSLDGHTTGMIRQVGLTSAQIQVNADIVIREYRGLKYLWDSGFLARLRPSAAVPGTQGLGNLWVALGIVAVLVVGSIVILGLLLWFRIAQQEQADKNAMQDKNCTYLLQTNDPGALEYCTKFSKPDSAITNAPQKIIEDVMKSVLTPLVYIAGFGGLLAVGIYFLPQIAGQWSSSKGKW